MPSGIGNRGRHELETLRRRLLCCRHRLDGLRGYSQRGGAEKTSGDANQTARGHVPTARPHHRSPTLLSRWWDRGAAWRAQVHRLRHPARLFSDRRDREHRRLPPLPAARPVRPAEPKQSVAVELVQRLLSESAHSTLMLASRTTSVQFLISVEIS